MTGDGVAPGGRIFISYASQDAAVALRIREGLEHVGLACWIAPRDIDPGTSFPAAITAAATACGALVLLLTEASNQSPHVLSEVELAFNARKPILAILVGRVSPSPNLQYFISTTHWFDADSSFDDEDLVRLQVDLRKLLAGERLRIEDDSGRHRRRAVRTALVAGAIVAAVGGLAFVVGKYLPAPASTSPAATAPAASPPASSAAAPSAEPTPGPAAARSAGPGTAVAPRTRTNPADGQVYAWIPPGRFAMGCSAGDPDCEPDEKPTHAVRIRNGFWLATTEVSVAQYGEQRPGKATHGGPPDTPVTNVDRAAAKAYCAAIGGRLPTEAEWEYAARGGTAERFYDTPSEVAWYDEDSDGHSHPVGRKTANAFGLYDMLGNVYEWVLDRYYNQYDDTDQAVEEPLAPNASGVARGGAWTSSAKDVRVSNRLELPPDAEEGNVGFRCALAGG